MNKDISLNPKELLAWLQRTRILLVSLILLGLFGYTGYQISHITAVQPDQAYIQVQQKAMKVPNLRVNKTVLSQLKLLQTSGDTTIQVTTGKSDPFSLH